MLRPTFNRQRFVGLLLFVALIASNNVGAQGLEEIIVTATKREQSLQEVPLAVNAISGARLEEFSISNFYDMDIPGVNIAQGGMNDNAFIRGVGQSSGNFGFENSAPYYIDGVYYGRARGTRLAWLDTERIEIIKGPVPTYLGKNASAGGIAITSRRPTDTLDGFIDVYQEFEHSETVVNGAISGPLSDSFRVRVAGKYRDLSDGWMTNTFLNIEEPQQEDTLTRVSAEWDVSENIQVYAKLETVTAEWMGRNTQQFACAANAPIDPVFEDCEFNDTRAMFFDPANHSTGIWDRELPVGLNFINDFEYIGASVQVQWDFGAATLSSTTAYYDYENAFFADASHSTDDRVMANFNEFYEQTSQELRLQSNGDNKVDWLVGVYYDENNNDNSTRNSVTLGPGMAIFRDNDEDADSFAVFGEVAFNVNDQVRITAGGRYTDYTKDNVYIQRIWAGTTAGQPFNAAMVVGMATFVLPNSQGDSKFQPALGVQWRPNDETMYYVTAKEGFKAGGLNHQIGGNDEVGQRIESEEVQAFELGAKWTLADGAARINAALFHASYENLQVSLFDPAALNFVTTNAGESSTQGLEVDAQWAVNENWQLGAYVSFLNADYDDYQGVNCYANPAQTVAEGCVELLDANGNPTGRFGQDLSGTPLSFAPDFSGTFTVDYRQPFGEGLEFFGTLSLFVTGEYQLNPNRDPDLRQDGYSKVDARFGIGSEDNKWSIAVVGRNLNDEEIFEWAGDTPANPVAGSSHFGLLKRTRQIALQGVYRWGD